MVAGDTERAAEEGEEREETEDGESSLATSGLGVLAFNVGILLLAGDTLPGLCVLFVLPSLALSAAGLVLGALGGAGGNLLMLRLGGALLGLLGGGRARGDVAVRGDVVVRGDVAVRGDTVRVAVLVDLVLGETILFVVDVALGDTEGTLDAEDDVFGDGNGLDGFICPKIIFKKKKNNSMFHTETESEDDELGKGRCR